MISGLLLGGGRAAEEVGGTNIRVVVESVSGGPGGAADEVGRGGEEEGV